MHGTVDDGLAIFSFNAITHLEAENIEWTDCIRIFLFFFCFTTIHVIVHFYDRTILFWFNFVYDVFTYRYLACEICLVGRNSRNAAATAAQH